VERIYKDAPFVEQLCVLVSDYIQDKEILHGVLILISIINCVYVLSLIYLFLEFSVD
jgi:hypothetical protein